MPEPNPYRFQAPAIPESLALARMFVATTARVFGLDEELVADLKLAASELVSLAVASDPPTTFTIEFTATTVAFSPVAPQVPSDEIDPLSVVVALFPDTRFDEERRSAAIPLNPTPVS